ncbi:MAG: 3,4-dihydroxy-2-butanone-4-phosphate synthase, partial [Alphaproteobacteria bacterium]
CAPMTRAIARNLRLDPMVADNDATHATAFTVSVDFKHGVTTGISADDRTATIRALANDNTGPADFMRPGHIFPLIGKDGGVLMRSGHTEACIDLCRLAGLPEVGAICELVNDDGTVMKGQQITDFADAHGLKLVSVADMIAYRQRSEKLVERLAEFEIDTPSGTARAITYQTPFDRMQHLALVFGDIRDGRAVPVRLQLEDVAADVFGRTRRTDAILERIAEHGRGIVIYLRAGSVGVARLPNRARDILEAGEDHDTALGRDTQWREIGLGAQVLTDLGVQSIRLLASRERHYVGLDGFGIVIDETEIFDI